MLQAIEFPPAVQIDVDYPQHDPVADPGSTMMNTALFRKGVFPEKTVPAVHDLQRKAGEICVFSFASSDGSELDTWLSYHNLSGDGRPVSAFGFDRHPGLVEQANSGVHLLPVALNSPRDIVEIGTILDNFGFAADLETVLESDGTRWYGRDGYFAIDANPVRDGHNVTFVQHDVRRELPVDKPAHLILVNNLLYHLTPADADAVIASSVSSLAKGGILVFSGASWNYMKDSHLWYDDWTEDVHDRLTVDEGLEPFDLDSSGVVRSYVRPQ